MAILNYRTGIKTSKTVYEIHELLSSKGAREILTEYGTTGGISALCFSVELNGDKLHFRLPAKVDDVLSSLKKARIEKRYKNEEQAERVYWRIIKDWIAAQMALIESEQADLTTVMLPYAIMQNRRTVAENLLGDQRNQFLLAK